MESGSVHHALRRVHEIADDAEHAARARRTAAGDAGGTPGGSRSCRWPWHDIRSRRDRARELVRGAVDYHIHVAPDFAERRITDVALARALPRDSASAGFGLKSHYTATAERAAGRARGGARRDVLGAITLNRAVGGLNALAVEVAAREGARIVWFPTVSSVNEQDEVLEADPNGKVPVWVRFELVPARGRRRRRARRRSSTRPARCCPRRTRCSR